MSTPRDYLPRRLDPALVAALRSAPVVILDGARATGKTTSAQRLAASSVLLPRDLEALRADPEGYLSALAGPVLIDEWQLAGPDVLWTLKQLVDDDPSPGRFILTGSVEPASYGPTYPLTGRSARLVMRPMAHDELAGRGDAPTFLERLLSGDITVTTGRPPTFTLEDLARPGFPAARDMSDPHLFLDGYAAVVAQRAGDEGRDATRLARTMRALATLTAQAIPDQSLWMAADINKATWKRYDDLLHRLHLSVPSPALESNRLARLTTYPKRFLCDTALALVLADLTIDQLRADRSLAGRFFEAFVLQQLRPQVDVMRGQILHVRTSAGAREVDAVIEIGQSLVGVEVKLGVRPTREDARPLAWLRDESGDRFAHGIVAHTGGDTYPLGERLTAVSIDDIIGEVHPAP